MLRKPILCLPSASVLVILGVTVLLATGCRSLSLPLRYKPPVLPSESANQEVAPYRVGAGDLLEVTTSDGKSSRHRIGAPGTIAIGGTDVTVDGLTCPEIESIVSVIAPVQVKVVEHDSQFIHVAGVGKNDGLRPVHYQGPETIEALVKRIGCVECASGYRVRVVRAGKNLADGPEIFSCEVDEKGKRTDSLNRPIRLQPGDFVYIEKNFGHKGPLTLLTDRRFLSRPLTLIKKVRLAEADNEIDRLH